MSVIMIDIESDGPIPGDYSRVSFGAVLVDEKRNGLKDKSKINIRKHLNRTVIT